MLLFLKDFWQFLTDNKDPLDTLLKLLTFLGLPLGAIFAAVGFLIRRWWLSRLRDEVGVFEVIAEAPTLLAKLYGTENNNSPLADHNIPYQRRDPNRDMQAELRQALNSTRYLLITARSGVGKTREAATLAHSLMNEGFRVLRVNPGWLDAPKELPRELRVDRRRILILLDDLNGLFRAGGYAQSPKAEQMLMLGQPSYHDRLLAALDVFEKMCGQSEIRVIATARDEADEWEKLNFNERDVLWKRFKRFEIPELPPKPAIELLKDLTARAALRAEADDFPAIARANDGTVKNVVVNLQRLLAENKPVTAESYTPSLGGSWRDVYERAARQHPAVRFIYDAIDILRQSGIELYPWIVRPTARMLWGGNTLQKLIRRYRIERGLRYLVDEQKILPSRAERLSPYDGQIEAKGVQTNWKQHIGFLHDLILRLADHYPQAVNDTLHSFGFALYGTKEFERAATLCRKGASLSKDARFACNLGIVLSELNRPAEAEEAYREALARDPNDANAYHNLGNLLHEKLQRYPEAEEAYRQALTRDPKYAVAYYSLGLPCMRNCSATPKPKRPIAKPSPATPISHRPTTISALCSPSWNALPRPKTPIAKPSPATPISLRPTTISALCSPSWNALPRLKGPIAKPSPVTPSTRRPTPISAICSASWAAPPKPNRLIATPSSATPIMHRPTTISAVCSSSWDAPPKLKGPTANPSPATLISLRPTPISALCSAS